MLRTRRNRVRGVRFGLLVKYRVDELALGGEAHGNDMGSTLGVSRGQMTHPGRLQ